MLRKDGSLDGRGGQFNTYEEPAWRRKIFQNNNFDLSAFEITTPDYQSPGISEANKIRFRIDRLMEVCVFIICYSTLLQEGTVLTLCVMLYNKQLERNIRNEKNNKNL